MKRLSMFVSRFSPILALSFAMVCASYAAEYSPVPPGVYNQGFDPTLTKEWKEAKAPLPSYPADANLLAVPLGAADTLKVYVDTRSVTQAEDLVLRMTYVVESPSGVRNVFYEGIRCEKGQYKTYAVGSTEKTLVPVKNPVWQDVVVLTHNAFRHHLRQYACDISSARAPENFLQHIKIGQ